MTEAPVTGSQSDSNPSSSAPLKTEGQKEVNPYAGTVHKLKVDNREVEVPYEQLVSDYQQKESSQRKFKEAARIKQEVDEFLGSLKSGDLKRLKGIVPADKLREFAEAELTEFIQYEGLSDADKARMRAESERDEYKKRMEERDEQDRNASVAAIEQEAHRELDLEIGQSIRDMKASLGIDAKTPIEPWFVDHIARLMLAHLETNENAEKMPAKVATERAWKGVENTVRSYLGSIPPDKALAILPPSLRDAIRKADVGDAVSQMQTRIRSKQTEEKAPPKKERSDSYDDWFDRKENRFGR